MIGRLFLAVIVAIVVILWVDPSILLDAAIGSVKAILEAIGQAIRDLIF